MQNVTAVLTVVGEVRPQDRDIRAQLDEFAVVYQLNVVEDDGFLEKSTAEQMLVG